MSKSTPQVIFDILSVAGEKPIRLDSGEWRKWLEKPETNSFRFTDEAVSYTVRRERKGENFFWYAYRRINGSLRKFYVGKAAHLTAENLRRIGQTIESQSVTFSSLKNSVRASQNGGWQELSPETVESVEIYVEEKEFESAARIIERHGWRILTRNLTVPLGGWLKALPVSTREKHPRLLVLQAWLSANAAELAEAESIIEIAEELIEASAKSRVLPLKGELSAAKACVARFRGDAAEIIEHSNEALSLLPKSNIYLRANIALNLGVALWLTDDFAEAEKAFRQAVGASRALDDFYATLKSLSHLARLKYLQGDLAAATVFYRQSVDLIKTQKAENLPVSAFAYIGFAELLYERNNLEEAERYAVAGEKLIRAENNLESLVGLYLTLARIRKARGNVEAGRQSLALAKEAAQSCSSPLMSAIVAAYAVPFYLESSDKLARLSFELEVQPVADYGSLGLIVTTAIARLRYARGEYAAALTILEDLARQTNAARRTRLAVEIRLLQVLALKVENDETKCFAVLAETLAAASACGYVRVFLDEGLPLANSLAEFIRESENKKARNLQTSPSYLRKLVGAFQAEFKRGRISPEEDGNYDLLPFQEIVSETLSKREIEILTSLAEGLSNREIGERHFIAVGTVKRHLNNLYGKLRATSRTQAVSNARRLQLI